MQDIGIKERLKYKDITWLMTSVNVEDVLVRLGIKVEGRNRNEIRALCPDHHLFVSRKSSDPNWFVNTDTGETNCYTEGRGSNLIWTICRLLDISPREAAKFMLGVESDADLLNLDLVALRHKIEQLKASYQVEKPEVRGLDVIAQDMKNRYMSEMAYRFFMHPPEKKYPTNIRRETVDKYNIFERTWGYYSNCVVIPFLLKGLLVGFCAIDMLGKSDWLRMHTLKMEKDYRKVRYPLNFTSGAYLFGYDDCQKNADLLVVVEGPREVMKLWQEGYTNAVAILGCHLSDTHLQMIASLAPKKVVLMFDGDDAGVETTTRVGRKLSASVFPGQRLQKCFLPRGRDPKNLEKDELDRLILGAEKSHF
jgi:5S rRNA maturation endonuclease (ribonuclease M5)